MDTNEQTPTPVAGPGAPAGRRADGRPEAALARASVVQVGTWIHEDTIARARAAFVADLATRGQDAPATYDEWVADAITALADLSPARRARLIAALPEEPALIPDQTAPPGQGEAVRPARKKGGKVRLPQEVADRMDAARLADHQAGQLRAKNTFLIAAIRIATQRAHSAHTRRTGHPDLPPAPERLPTGPRKKH